MSVEDSISEIDVVDNIFESKSEDLPDIPGRKIADDVELSEEPVEEDEVQVKNDSEDEETDEKPKVKSKKDTDVKKDEKNLTKKVPIRVGDKELEIEEDATIKVKVDGKVEEIPLKEALNNYSGKVAWDKRFNEVAKARREVEQYKRAFEAEKQQTEELVNSLHQGLTNGDLFGTVANLINLSGSKLDPQAYVRDLRKTLIQHAQQISQLTPEQIELLELREAREFERKRYDSLAKQREREQAEVSLRAREAKLLEEAKLSEDEYADLREQILNLAQANGKKLDPKVLTPEFVIDYKKRVDDYKVVQEAANEVDPTVLEQVWEVKQDGTKISVWDKLVSEMRESGLSKKDLVSVLSAATKKARAASVSKKVAKTPVATLAKQPIKSSKNDLKIDLTNITAEDLVW